MEKLKELSGEVSEKSNGYPSNPINGAVWLNGAIVRNWCDALSYLFDMRGRPYDKAIVLQCKCKVTCSIMSHYRHAVGPDMIEAAAALVAINETDTAINYYTAVIADFEPFARMWDQHPEEPVEPDDLISLRALLDAYNGWQQLDPTQDFAPRRSQVEQLIQRAKTTF